MRPGGRLFWLLGLALLAMAPDATPADKAGAAKMRQADVATPDAVVSAVYESISGSVGKERDWARMRYLWLASARIILSSDNYQGKARYENISLETFIGRVSDYYKEEGFFERELTSTSVRFGNIAQIWSTFEIRKGSVTGPVINRGINSWQLVEKEGRWWISQLTYDFESSKHPIPDRYLKP
jgi:hypothetical protein